MIRKYIIICSVVLLVAAGYLYLRFGILKSKDFQPDPSKSASVLDLRPALIARLQQLVKDGSNGLYVLTIDKLRPDVVTSSLDVINATLTPDSLVLAALEKDHKAPDNVVTLSFDSLYIHGIGLHDLLDKDQIDIKTFHFINPVVNIHHLEKLKKGKDEKRDSVTLYRLLMKSIKKIKIGAVLLDNGTFINHSVARQDNVTHIEHIAVNMKDILVDSSTQYDKKRFLFAKTADISLKNYVLRTADSLYFFKASSIMLSAVDNTLTAVNIEFLPRGNRVQFKNRLRHRKDMLTFKTSRVVLKHIDLYTLINDKKLLIDEAAIENAGLTDFFDTSVPKSTSAPEVKDFPHQQLMSASLPVYIRQINVKRLNVQYEELNSSVQKSGSVYFNDVNGRISNITNIPEYIRKNNKTKFSATALFMKKADLQAVFSFDLKNFSNGHFTVDATLGRMEGSLLNGVSEPLGFVSIKKGTINKVVAHVDGDNYKGRGKLLLLYDDLHLDPLKKDDEGKLKKRGLLSFLANFILIKNANPLRNKNPRTEACYYTRDPHGSFFNLIFKTILTGALKTIGLPEKLAYK